MFILYIENTGRELGTVKTKEEAEKYCKSVEDQTSGTIRIGYREINLIEDDKISCYYFEGKYSYHNQEHTFNPENITGKFKEISDEKELNKIYYIEYKYSKNSLLYDNAVTITILGRAKTKEDFENLVKNVLEDLKTFHGKYIYKDSERIEIFLSSLSLFYIII